MDEILKKLKEIDNKLNVMLSHCFIEHGKSFMDIYQESHVKTPTIIIVDSSNKLLNQEVIDYAIKTKNFKIDKNFMIVEYEGNTYYINKDTLT